MEKWFSNEIFTIFDLNGIKAIYKTRWIVKKIVHTLSLIVSVRKSGLNDTETNRARRT